MIDFTQKLKEAPRGLGLQKMINYICVEYILNGDNDSYTRAYPDLEGRDKIG
jgi:hypothetical protein